MTKPFELGGLQMILYVNPMSNSSGGTHLDQASRIKFSFFEKMCKKLLYFLKQKIAVIQAKSFCVQKISKKVEFFILEVNNITKVVSFSRAICYCSLIF